MALFLHSLFPLIVFTDCRLMTLFRIIWFFWEEGSDNHLLQGCTEEFVENLMDKVILIWSPSVEQVH